MSNDRKHMKHRVKSWVSRSKIEVSANIFRSAIYFWHLLQDLYKYSRLQPPLNLHDFGQCICQDSLFLWMYFAKSHGRAFLGAVIAHSL